MLPRVLILYVKGINREQDLSHAFAQAGAASTIVPLIRLPQKKQFWKEYQILALPGGFANADTLGSGKLFALTLTQHFNELLHHFVETGKPVIGICNGFQTLVKAGLLPTPTLTQTANLAINALGRFECRWVTLTAHSKQCLWTQGLVEPIDCPIAHGEGRLVLTNPEHSLQLEAAGQIALRYATKDGQQASGKYPANPNGSWGDIAGLCNPKGNVLGLMPHPENHIFNWQHPKWTQGKQGRLGLALFQQGVHYVK